MAMLAEPKRKQKFGNDPRNSFWSKDESKFGFRMLESMGWTKGKGLGANESGRTEHVKAVHRLNTDARGVGCSKSHADRWIAHQDDFNSLLSSLNDSPAEGGEDAAVTVSLEEKSKFSRSRVHYHKYTRGKDLSSRSSHDLDCIFGKRKSQASENSTPTAQSEANSDEDSSSGSDKPKEDDNNNPNGIKTITSTTSVQEYFAIKMAELKRKREAASNGFSTAEDSIDATNVLTVMEDTDQEVKLTGNEASGYIDEAGGKTDGKKKKRKSDKEKRKCEREDSLQKGDVNKEFHPSAEFMIEASADMEDNQDRRKKKKKARKESTESEEEDLSQEGSGLQPKVTQGNEDVSCQLEEEQEDNKKSKKKKKKAKKDTILMCESGVEGNSEMTLEEEQSDGRAHEADRKKKKKSKKGKLTESETCEDKTTGEESEKIEVAETGQSEHTEVENTSTESSKKDKKRKRRNKPAEEEEEEDVHNTSILRCERDGNRRCSKSVRFSAGGDEIFLIPTKEEVAKALKAAQKAEKKNRKRARAELEEDQEEMAEEEETTPRRKKRKTSEEQEEEPTPVKTKNKSVEQEKEAPPKKKKSKGKEKVEAGDVENVSSAETQSKEKPSKKKKSGKVTKGEESKSSQKELQDEKTEDSSSSSSSSEEEEAVKSPTSSIGKDLKSMPSNNTGATISGPALYFEHSNQMTQATVNRICQSFKGSNLQCVKGYGNDC